AGVASFLNTSTANWLARAAKAMTKRYGNSFAVFILCETRWNSMQACFASLLPRISRTIFEFEFWTKLETAEKIVRPLCTASFRLQRDENTVADVVISFYGYFSGGGLRLLSW
ncbi:hypothetical protein L916_00482, partial [Phytophthora nicotianae]